MTTEKMLDRLNNWTLGRTYGFLHDDPDVREAIRAALAEREDLKAKLAEFIRRAREIRDASWNDELFKRRPQDLIRDLAGEKGE